MSKFLNILIKTIGIIILTLLSFVVMAYYALQLPEVQTNLTQKATEWLGKKLGGNVTVSAVRITWIDEVTFEDINIKDLEGRDMIFVRELYINCKSNFLFNYKDFIKFDNNLDYVLLKNPEVKLVKEKDGVLNIDNWIAKIEQLTTDTSKVSIIDLNIPFTIDNAYIQDGFISVSDPREPKFPKEEFDYYNFRFDKLNANLEKVLILGDTVSFNATSLKAIDYRSDLRIKELKTNFLYCKTAMLLNNLSAFINNSYLGNSLGFYYDKPSAFKDFNSKVKLKGTLKNSYFDAKDLGRFAPALYAYKENYRLNSKLIGTFDNISFNEFDLKFGKSSELYGDVNFKGFPDLAKTDTKLKLKASRLTKDDVKQYSSDPEFQNYITKIENLKLSGSYEGFYNDFKSDISLESKGLGMLKGKVNVNLGKSSEEAMYFGDFEIAKIDLGKLIDEPLLLKNIDFTGKIKGTGLKISDADLVLDGQVKNIDYNGYNYQNISLDGKLKQSIFDGILKVNDENLTANVEGKIDFNKELNSFKIKGELLNANLKNLGITESRMAISSEINFDFIGNKVDEWIGRAQFLKTNIYEDGKVLKVDSMFFNSTVSDNLRRYSMISEFFNVYINGRFVPSQLISDLTEVVKEYKLFFNDTEASRASYYANKKNNKNIQNYSTNYKMFFKNSTDFFTFFEPDLYISPGSNLEGKFTTRSTVEFSSFGTIDTLVYKKSGFYNTKIDFNTSKTTFSPEVLSSIIIDSESQSIKDNVATENLSLNAYWGQFNNINFDASIKQQSTNSLASVFGEINFLTDGFDIIFNHKNSNVVLVNNKWSFDNENKITVNNDRIDFQNLKLFNKTQSVSLNGTISKDIRKELVLQIEDLDLLTLKPFTNQDFKGIANGVLTLQDYYNSPFFTSSINIDKLILDNSLIGNIVLEANWDNLIEKLEISSTVHRLNKEIVRINGNYDPEDKKNPLDLNAKFRDVNLEMLDGILAGSFSNISGTAVGDIKITGMPLQPIFNGEIDVLKGKLTIDATGSSLYFDDKIICNSRGFLTPTEGITLYDAYIGGNIATLKGGILNAKDGDFTVDLMATMQGKDGFKILETKSSDNSSFYGNAYTVGDLSVKGGFNNLEIIANLTSKKGTKITIPLDSEKSIDVQQEGIPFIGKADEKTDKIDPLSKKFKAKNEGIKLSFNLTLTPDAEGEIIFDRTNNDVLDVFGDGKLTIVYDSRGEFTINGPYVVKNGKYNFSFQNLASLRKFNIVDGSRITWSGDPYDAILDLKAQYTANIPISKIPNLSEDKNRYPVNVLVSLTNRIMTPNIKYEIHFDVKQIPIASQTSVLSFEQKLQTDEQLLSRNVSSILVFNDIFPDNLTEAFTQQFLIDNVSNLLSNQIGNLANKLNPNLELGVQFGDVRNNLLNNMQLNFSYRFLNNRIKLSGKSSFVNTLESSINQNSVGQLSVGGEIEYLLSPDGEFKFKLYSRSVPTNYYIFSSGGNVVVSGGNLVISRNFNSFFNRNKSDKFPLGTTSAKKEEEINFSPNTIQ